MFKKYKNVAIAFTIVSLLFVGLAFQNCAAPLDPSLLEDSSTELGSETNEPQALNFSSQASPMEVEVGQPVHIATEILASSGNAKVDIYKNGSMIATGQFYQVPSVAMGDTFKVIVTDGTIVQERPITLFIKPKDDGGGNTGGGNNNSGKAYLKNVSGTMPFTKYFVADKVNKSFSVELDFSKTDSMYSSADITWEKSSNTQERWVHHSSSRDLTITGNPAIVEQHYRAVAKYQGNVVGTSAIITVITKSYNSSTTICASGYVIAGINTFRTTKVKSSRCKRGNDEGCDEYYYDYHKSPSSVICKLPQDRTKPNDYYGSSASRTTGYQSGGTPSYCNGSTVRKSSLISALGKTSYTASSYAYACSNLILESRDVFQTRTLETMRDTNQRVCPEYEYMVGFHRHKSLWRYGVVERIYCAEIAD